MTLTMPRNNSLAGTLFYSSLAFHSPGNILNDFDSLMIQIATGNPNMSISTVNQALATSNSLSSSASYLEVLGCIDILPLSLLSFINGIIVSLMISFMVS